MGELGVEELRLVYALNIAKSEPITLNSFHLSDVTEVLVSAEEIGTTKRNYRHRHVLATIKTNVTRKKAMTIVTDQVKIEWMEPLKTLYKGHTIQQAKRDMIKYCGKQGEPLIDTYLINEEEQHKENKSSQVLKLIKVVNV